MNRRSFLKLLLASGATPGVSIVGTTATAAQITAPVIAWPTLEVVGRKSVFRLLDLQPNADLGCADC